MKKFIFEKIYTKNRLMFIDKLFKFKYCLFVYTRKNYKMLSPVSPSMQ